MLCGESGSQYPNWYSTVIANVDNIVCFTISLMALFLLLLLLLIIFSSYFFFSSVLIDGKLHTSTNNQNTVLGKFQNFPLETYLQFHKEWGHYSSPSYSPGEQPLQRLSWHVNLWSWSTWWHPICEPQGYLLLVDMLSYFGFALETRVRKSFLRRI